MKKQTFFPRNKQRSVLAILQEQTIRHTHTNKTQRGFKCEYNFPLHSHNWLSGTEGTCKVQDIFDTAKELQLKLQAQISDKLLLH